MTHKELKRVKKIHGIGFKRIDVPAWLRRKEAECERVEEGRQENVPSIPDPFDLK